MADLNFTNPSFTDKRLFLVRTNSDKVGIISNEHDITLRQAWDGPRYLVIGHQVKNERIECAAIELGIDPKMLVSFRDGFQNQMEITA